MAWLTARRDVMRLLQHIASVLLLIALWCPAAQAAGQPDPLADVTERRAGAAVDDQTEHSHGMEQNRDLARITRQFPDHSDVQPAQSLTRDISAKWRDVLARIGSEEETLAACRASPDVCSPAARRLLQLVELGR